MTSSSGTQHHSLVCRLDGDHVVRIEDEFLGSGLVKVLIALGCILQRNDGGVHRFGDLYLIMENCIHQLTMVAHNGALTCGKGEGLGPAQINANTKLTNLRLLVDASWSTCHIE